MSELILKEGELDKLFIIKQAKEKKIPQEEAAHQLQLSVRQVCRLVRRIKLEGSKGIKRRSYKSKKSFSSEVKQKTITILKDQYADFGPTFASEKLELLHKIKVNKETLRQWMIEAGIWTGRARKRARIHQSRERRHCFGELVQIDGSHHDWFEGRAAKCCLLVFIDDATSKIVGLHFEPTETTLGYMKLIESHLVLHGKPIAYYSDKHSIFKTTREHCVDGRFQDTQVHRALRELRIELICAHSSQAKGRVERANQTLQDRLIKEMRLRGISTIEEANKFAQEFMIYYNERFSVPAAKTENAHRPVSQDKQILRNILSIQSIRILTKNLEFSLNNIIYSIKTITTGYRLRYKKVKVCEHFDGRIDVLCDNQPLKYQVLTSTNRAIECDSKEINTVMDKLIYSNNITLPINVIHKLHHPCPA